jgi:hypothetical protein
VLDSLFTLRMSLRAVAPVAPQSLSAVAADRVTPYCSLAKALTMVRC